MEGEATEEGISLKSQNKNVKNNQLIKGLIFKEVPEKKRSTSPLEMGERGCIILFIYFYCVCVNCRGLRVFFRNREASWRGVEDPRWP
jgi:hypothetical protein